MKRQGIFIITVLFLACTLHGPVNAVGNAEKEMIRGNYPRYYNYAGCGGNQTAVVSKIPVGSKVFELPAASGYTATESAIDENGAWVTDSSKKVAYAHHAKLGQAYRDFYITMRWTTHKWYWGGGPLTAPEAQIVDPAQISWLSEKPRMVLVTNKRNNQSIYAAILESGPAPWTGVDTSPNNDPKGGWSQPQLGTPTGYQGRVSGFPPPAMLALDAKTREGGQQNGDELVYIWAPNQDVTPGPTTDSAINSTPDDQQCEPGQDGIGGGLGVSPDGFVFPIKTTKPKMEKNAYFKPNCRNKVSSMGSLGTRVEIDGLCHHDYLAADIQTPVGTEVVAPRPGRVIRSGQSNDRCIGNNLSIYSDPALGGDGNSYYFAHLNSEHQAKKGDIIEKAGERIGTIGDPGNCFKPHLHIDISPIQSPFKRNSDGTWGPLLDPQPALVAAYNKLPEN